MTRHVDPMVLEQAELPAEAEVHLQKCPRCRIDRRILLDLSESDPGDLLVLPAALPDAKSLVETWRSARSGTLIGLPTDFEDDDELPDPGQLGPYAIDARLGHGGMAVVYRIVDRRTGKHRALKVLRRADPELRRRLAREGRVQGDLDAPNVVRVLDVLQVDDSPALVLEYVAGPTLQQVLRDEPLPLAVVDRVAAEILAGMAAAHSAGVIHRDLKPGNVLLDPVGDDFVARVTDFGLARASEATDSLHTRTGAFAGTPMYMAPEQLRDASRADARSDVFSLGALLYELVTGLRCFAGLDYVDIVRRVADVRWTPIDDARPGVPDRMRRAIAAALQVNPDDRPSDAGALRELWAPETPDAPWPEQRVFAGVALHDPDLLDVSGLALPDNNLQPAVDTFVGRDVSRQTIAGLLADERLVTLTGPGGVGKTRLAIEVARHVAHAFEGGVWFCDLIAARSVDGIAAAVAQALQIGLDGDPVQRVGSALASRGPTLLVLDNFEQVVEHAEATVEVWLERAPEATLLVTSREPLDLFDEVPHAVDILTEDEAVDLFVSRARRALPDFVVDDDNRETVHQIVRRLDALPLAVEIVAARVRSHDLGRIRAHLDRFSGDRHATLRQTLDASWDLLSSSERGALTQLTVFETPCTPAAAAAILGDTAPAVEDLVRRSLVRQVGERIRLLVPIRQWAGGKLSDADRAQAEAAHGAYFAALELDGADDVLADLWMATTRALERGDLEIADRAGLGAHSVLLRRGPLRRALSLVDAILEHDRCAGVMRGWWLHRRGRLGSLLGRSEAAMDDLREAAAIAVAADAYDLQADALNWLGIALADVGRTAEARDCYEQALAISERTENDQRAAFLFGALAVLSKREGDLDAARRQYERSLQGHRALGNERGIAMVLGDLGTVDLQQGHPEVAETRILEAIEILARHHNAPGEAVGWSELSDVYKATGRPELAREALLKCRDLNRAAGAQRAEIEALWGLAGLELSDDLGQASATLEEALRIARDTDDAMLIGQTLQNLSEVRAAQGSTQLAERLAAQAAELLT